MTPRAAVASAFVLLLLASASASLAFDSCCITPEHKQLIQQAGEQLGLSAKTIKGLKQAVVNPDYFETDIWTSNGDLRLHPNEYYAPQHHFDRNPFAQCDTIRGGVRDGSVSDCYFNKGRNYFRDCMQSALGAANNGDYELAVESLGKALHALQDLKSHSNLIDLSENDQFSFEAALFQPSAIVPLDVLKLTSYSKTYYDQDPEHNNPETPTDPDHYQHKSYAKDRAKKNPECLSLCQGSTQNKFECAFAQALENTVLALTEIRDNLDGDKWDSLKNALVVASARFDSAYRWKAVLAVDANPASAAYQADSMTIESGTFTSPDTIEVLEPPLTFFGMNDEQMFVPNGAEMRVLREVRLNGVAPQHPVRLAIGFENLELFDREPATLAIYRYDHDAAEWVAVNGAIVDGFGRRARFEITEEGLYGVGGLLRTSSVPPPGSRDARLSILGNPSHTGSVRVRLSIGTAVTGSLSLYDASGRRVRTLARGRYAAGAHVISIDAASLSNGVYFLRWHSTGRVTTLPVVMAR
jgi:hypothetical protein